MKKTSIILAFVLFVTLAFSGAAFAATNGPHGGFTAETAACGSCHSTHAAPGQNMTVFALAGTNNAAYEACTYCHSASGESKYDVVNGVIESTGGKYYRSEGGGYDNVFTGTEGGTTLTTSPTTSTHEVKAIGGTLVAPGNANGNGTTFPGMSCNNCHSGHGTNLTRQLLKTVNGVSVLPTLTVANEFGDEKSTYVSGINEFCAACHTDFNATAAGSSDTNNGSTLKKRHRVGMGLGTLTTALPLQSANVACYLPLCTRHISYKQCYIHTLSNL